jgi:hypothetical protein
VVRRAASRADRRRSARTSASLRARLGFAAVCVDGIEYVMGGHCERSHLRDLPTPDCAGP